jgi:hypothetical protein
MITHALRFADEIKAGQQEAFQALLTSYKTVDMPSAPNFVDLENAKETIETLMQMRRDAKTRLTGFNFVVANPEQFDIPATLNITAVIGDFEAAIAKLSSAASRCVNSPTDAPAVLLSVAGLKVPVAELPPRRRSGLEDVFAGKGKLVITTDPLLAAMRALEPDGPGKLGFEIGVGIGDGDTAWGPGKQAHIDALPVDQQPSAVNAAHFIVARNTQLVLATSGAAVARSDARPEVLSARTAQAPGYYTLGFDIAAGLFANAALGGAAHTGQGPGATAIRNALPPAGIAGFDRAAAIYMGK